jgi:hypothetical protein
MDYTYRLDERDARQAEYERLDDLGDGGRSELCATTEDTEIPFLNVGVLRRRWDFRRRATR